MGVSFRYLGNQAVLTWRVRLQAWLETPSGSPLSTFYAFSNTDSLRIAKGETEAGRWQLIVMEKPQEDER